MSEETKVIEEKKCFCQSEGVKNFAVVALGTFVGGLCAINLFAALNKPPMMIPMNPMMFGSGHHQMMIKQDFNFSYKRKMMKKHFEKKAEFHKKMLEKKNLEKKD